MLEFLPFRGSQKFKVKRENKDIDTEEIFIDALTHKKAKGAYSMEMALSQRIFQVTLASFLFIILLLFIRLFYLQVFEYNVYAEKSEKNKYISTTLDAQRGIIYDCNLNQLAFNSQNFELICSVDNFPEDTFLKEKQIIEISRILDMPLEQLFSLIDENEKSSFSIIKNLEKEKAIVIKTKAKELSGFSLINKKTREYLDGNNFSHILGYVSGDEFKGESGIENQYNEQLKEIPGVINWERDVYGNLTNEEIIKPSQSGSNLVLSIDFDLQKKVSEYLEEVVSTYGAIGGAVIISNPQSGEILSLASNPSFDSNIFSKNLNNQEFNELLKNPNVSFYNRAIAGEYPVASTIKPIIGLVALEESVIDINTSFYCDGGIELKDGTYKSDWKIHGFTDLKKAIAESCDVFFYHVGGGYNNFVGLGIEKIEKYLNYFGFGKKTGIDLPGEKVGLLPTPDWKKEKTGLPWYPGDTYNLSIGQGYLRATPLQLNMAIASIANGGKIMKPRIVKSILDANNQTLEEFESEVILENFISKSSINQMKESMKGTVTSPLGTARSLQYLPVSSGAKTGTAETGKKEIYHNWITVFAPFEEPEIILTIVVESVPNNMNLANLIAREVLGYYFGEKERNQPDEEIINEAGN